MSSLTAVAQAGAGGQVSEIIEHFGVNWPDLLAQSVCFLVLAYILNRFVFKPVMKTVEARRKEAEDAAANAERIKESLRVTEEAKGEILAKAREQAEKIISETKANAAELMEKEKCRIEEIATQMLEKSREDALLDRKNMRTEMKNEIAGLAAKIAAIVSEKTLSDSDRSNLLAKAVSAMDSSKAKE